MTWLLYCYEGQIVANSVSFMCSLNTDCITSNVYIEWGKLFLVIDVVHVLQILTIWTWSYTRKGDIKSRKYDGRFSVVQRTVTLEGDMIKSGGGGCFTEFECFVIPTRKGISTSYISKQTT